MSIVNKNILAVDDDESILILVKKIIEGAGAQCVTATSVKEGLLMALINTPHLIIVDLSIPEIDGFTFLEKKKTISRIKNIPTLVLTALPERRGLNRAMASGADDYLRKPLNASLLLQKIRKCLHSNDSTSTVKFSEKQQLTVQIPAELTELNNAIVGFHSSVKLSPGNVIRLDSNLFDTCGKNRIILKIEDTSTPTIENGLYYTRGSCVGLTDEEQKLVNSKVRRQK